MSYRTYNWNKVTDPVEQTLAILGQACYGNYCCRLNHPNTHPCIMVVEANEKVVFVWGPIREKAIRPRS